ncbi:MAG: response regulator [Candidatus Latescibacteria bacterium]|nr:response regulator [Candidatus Latescibacterota bacterium]
MYPKDHPYTILVVDDEEDIRLLLEDILSVHYRILTAADGLEALELIVARPDEIDLVMTDLRMPRMDGMELAQKVRAEYPRIGVIMISAHGTISEAVQALKKGVYDYLTKPLPADLQEIYAKCERYFRTRELEQQQEKLKQEVLTLSYFPRSDPDFLVRACPVQEEVILLPGNEKTAALLRHLAGEDPDEAGRFRYLQGQVSALFPPDFKEILQRIVGTDEVVEVGRIQIEGKYYRHIYTPFIDNRSDIFIHIADITRQVENEQLRTMLEAGMEHEFKNLLTLITPYAEMIHSERLGPLTEKQKEALAYIIQAGNQLLDSLTARLEFSRAYSGTLRLNKAQVDLYSLVRKVYGRLQRAAADKVFKVAGIPYDSTSPAPQAVAVECDPQYLERVLDNLIGNALKHAPWVDIAIEARTEEVLVQISDGGEGMDEEDRQGIWTLGYRAKNRKGKSTGIGLPYSKLIVEAHGGQIGVRSAPGKGSTFYFTLPRQASN